MVSYLVSIIKGEDVVFKCDAKKNDDKWYRLFKYLNLIYHKRIVNI